MCVVIFKDVASKKKYDNYVNLTKYRAVNEAVDELALSNQKRIEPKMKESLIDIAVRQYHVSVSDASVYIKSKSYRRRRDGYIVLDKSTDSYRNSSL